MLLYLHPYAPHRDTRLELADTGLVVVSGLNGSGKSSLVEAYAAAHWGRSLRGASAWRTEDCRITVAQPGLSVERTPTSLTVNGETALTQAVRRAEAERDAQHEQVLRLTAERDAVSVVHACPPKGSGVMPCCGATPFEKQGERLTADLALVNCDRQRLIAENARLQKEHNAYVQRLSADALQVASKYQRDLDEARAQIATLELLQRGGK